MLLERIRHAHFDRALMMVLSHNHLVTMVTIWLLHTGQFRPRLFTSLHALKCLCWLSLVLKGSSGMRDVS